GVAQLVPIDPYKRVEAETIAWTSRIKRDRDRSYDWAPGVTTARDDHIGIYVTRITDRSYIKVAGVDFGKAGATAFVASVANGRPRSSIELRLDRVDGPVIGTVQVGDTGAGGQWLERTASVTGAAGTHDLYMVFKGGGEP
ncbi:MAG: carbohydrate-binding protein, partial [Sphingomonas sp.]